MGVMTEGGGGLCVVLTGSAHTCLSANLLLLLHFGSVQILGF